MADYTKLVEALRETAKHLDGISRFPYDDDPAKRIYSKKMTDAADAIEALQAQLPKLGSWQKAKPKGVVTYSDGYAECSHCHEAIWLGWKMYFCPHCGTQNRIIDHDDYVGAKMEETDADRLD